MSLELIETDGLSINESDYCENLVANESQGTMYSENDESASDDDEVCFPLLFY